MVKMKDFERFEKDAKESYIRFLTHRIVNEFMAYKNHLNINEYNFNHIVKGAEDTINLTEKEMKQIIKDCKKILKGVYGISIINENPIILEEVHR